MSDSTAGLDTSRLRPYVEQTLDVDVATVEVLADGLNLIVKLETTGGDTLVLRRPNKLRETYYLNELDGEYGVLERLADTSVPAPHPVLFCDDPDVLDGEFYVARYLDGAVVPLGDDLPDRFRHPDGRRALAHRLIDTLADIHVLDTDRFTGVGPQYSLDERLSRSTDRIEDAETETGLNLTRLSTVGDWLSNNVPSVTDTTLVHGDFRPGNVLFAGTRDPQVSGVLDWETASLGHPLIDLGYLLLRWQTAADALPTVDEIEIDSAADGVVDDLREMSEHGLAPFTEDAGSPSRRELADRYEVRTGRPYEHDQFYRAYAAFSLATVWMDLHRHALANGAESVWPPYIEFMSRFARRIADGEVPL